MKKTLLILTLILLQSLVGAQAQWCTPASAIPYNASMPGITHVLLNTINRFSADIEDYPNNSYVNTGMSSELIPGQTYNFSITFTVDATICPDMNIRVWIDYNQDYQLDDIGETVISANNRPPGVYSGSFTVPPDALPGTTRMRVTAKMTPNGGHTLPTPCDMPADPFGYHGEIEDYDILISSSTGIQNITKETSFDASVLNDKLQVSFVTEEASDASISLYDISGQLVNEILPEQKISAGEHHVEINQSELKIQSGFFLAVLICNNEKQVVRIVIP